jgi:hypothetical protein
MKAIGNRLSKLESRSFSADRPRSLMRLQIMPLGSKLCLADARCQRMISADGTLMELVHFLDHDEGADELGDGELDRWVEYFPIVRS